MALISYLKKVQQKQYNYIHKIEKKNVVAWNFKYKQWTMGPHGFLGRTLLALQIKSPFQKCLHYSSFLHWYISKKPQTVSSFCDDKFTTSPVLDT